MILLIKFCSYFFFIMKKEYENKLIDTIKLNTSSTVMYYIMLVSNTEKKTNSLGDLKAILFVLRLKKKNDKNSLIFLILLAPPI